MNTYPIISATISSNCLKIEVDLLHPRTNDVISRIMAADSFTRSGDNVITRGALILGKQNINQFLDVAEAKLFLPSEKIIALRRDFEETLHPELKQMRLAHERMLGKHNFLS